MVYQPFKAGVLRSVSSGFNLPPCWLILVKLLYLSFPICKMGTVLALKEHCMNVVMTINVYRTFSAETLTILVGIYYIHSAT